MFYSKSFTCRCSIKCVMMYVIEEANLNVQREFFFLSYFGLSLVNDHCVVWKRVSYHALIGCLLFKANDS